MNTDLKRDIFAHHSRSWYLQGVLYRESIKKTFLSLTNSTWLTLAHMSMKFDILEYRSFVPLSIRHIPPSHRSLLTMLPSRLYIYRPSMPVRPVTFCCPQSHKHLQYRTTSLQQNNLSSAAHDFHATFNSALRVDTVVYVATCKNRYFLTAPISPYYKARRHPKRVIHDQNLHIRSPFFSIMFHFSSRSFVLN